jgi:PTS system nitrogen regulatory IIA component
MYLNIIELAESLGVSEGVITDWIRHDALPHTTDRDRLLFDRAQVAEWAAARGLAARAGFLAPTPNPSLSSLALAPLLESGGIWRDVPPSEAASCCGRILSALPGVTPAVRQMLAQRLRAPGGITWAPVGEGWAIPHPSARVSLGRDAGVLGLILLRGALDLGEQAVDATPVSRLLFFVAPSPRVHLDLLGRISRLLTRERPAALIDPGADDGAVRAAFAASDARNGASGKGHP